MYQSGIGMLLYLVKYSRPDIANPVRELSNVLAGSTTISFKEMLHITKYVLDTKDMGLNMEPTQFNKLEDEPWELVYYSNCDYAGDPESGYILYMKGVPVCW